MGTRANIQFRDEFGTVFHVYRGHDGGPENVMADLQALLTTANGRWSGSEIDCLVTLFLSMTWDWRKQRLPDYVMTTKLHGDEGRFYEVVYELDAVQPMFGTRGRWIARANSLTGERCPST